MEPPRSTDESERVSEAPPEAPPEAEKPSSCLGCRKRKLKCSRDLPSCSHCQRLDTPCVYDTKKSKPGLRPGAIEALNQRIEALEHALADRGAILPRPDSHADGDVPASPSVVGILATLAQELQKLNARAAAAAVPVPVIAPPNPAPPNQHRHTPASSPESSAPRKRRRHMDSCGNPSIALAAPLEDVVDLSPGLPSPDVLEEVVNAYFWAVQPWIPVLHETQFRRRMHDPEQLPQLTGLLHAMVVAVARYVPAEGGAEALALAERSRSFVVLRALDSLSVENLQALVIIAFHDIGCGRPERAWSLVGSLTRTVEYLQLSVEDEDDERRPLLPPHVLLPPPQNWVEEEERRRVFWNIFLLDRFCSISTGWNISLTADDVHRRLPADGFFFHKEEPVLTPYFGIWDRSVAKLGTSVAFLPAHHAGSQESSSSVHDGSSHASGSPTSSSHHSSLHRRHHGHGHGHHHTPARNPRAGDMAHVGAFAYNVEATESLSQVTTYFLQQSVDFDDRQQVSGWLTRFKELDLRLVHWKMFLPQRWKDSNVSRQPALVNMDPNLTLAHVTHNTSMILLHQHIAYPGPTWSKIVQLPSFCSAETCQIAAVETANITEKYLRYTDAHYPVANQFAFCVYVSARVLLVHWRCHRTEILPEFWSLLRSLDEMARRWIGVVSTHDGRPSSLAGAYADQLRALHQQCLADSDFVIDVLGYASSTVASLTNSDSHVLTQQQQQQPQPQPQPQPQQQQQQQQPLPLPPQPQVDGTQQPQWAMQAPPPPALGQISPSVAFQQQPPSVTSPSVYGASTGPTDDLSAISHILLDQRFVDLDRVISFDDSYFTAPGRWS